MGHAVEIYETLLKVLVHLLYKLTVLSYIERAFAKRGHAVKIWD